MKKAVKTTKFFLLQGAQIKLDSCPIDALGCEPLTLVKGGEYGNVLGLSEVALKFIVQGSN